MNLSVAAIKITHCLLREVSSSFSLLTEPPPKKMSISVLMPAREYYTNMRYLSTVALMEARN